MNWLYWLLLANLVLVVLGVIVTPVLLSERRWVLSGFAGAVTVVSLVGVLNGGIVR